MTDTKKIVVGSSELVVVDLRHECGTCGCTFVASIPSENLVGLDINDLADIRDHVVDAMALVPDDTKIHALLSRALELIVKTEHFERA